LGGDPAIARIAFSNGKANDTKSKTHNPISPIPRINTNGKEHIGIINMEI